MPVVFYGCETWSLILRKESRLTVSEVRVLKKIFGPKRDEVTVEWKDCIMKSFVICNFHEILFVHSNWQESERETSGTYEKEQRCIKSFGGET